MIQVHLFSEWGEKLPGVVESVQIRANTFFREQAISEEELLHCELSLAAGDEWTEVVMLVVVDVEPEITEEQMDAALREAVGPLNEERVKQWLKADDAARDAEEKLTKEDVEQALQPWKETLI